MNVAEVQTKLGVFPDGLFGPKSYAALLSFAAGRDTGAAGTGVGAAMAHVLPGGGVVGDLGLIHWTAQACHETMGFKYFYELGGPTYFTKYDGRADLGNTEPGDGYRYRGRGIFQLTGRANYATVGKQLSKPLLEQPDLAADYYIAVVIACWYWRDRKIQVLADADDTNGVTRRINGGLNGLPDRQAITTKLKGLIRPNG